MTDLPRRPQRAHRSSWLMASASARLAGAVALSGLLWLAVLWALDR